MIKEFGENKLIKGCGLELLSEISDNSIDFIFADLPYGVTAAKWDEKIDFKKLWAEYNRIIKPNRSIALFSSQPFTTDLINSNRKNYRYCWY